ncbi:CopD family protein [Fulvivirga sedimenti]|uniref:Protoporphyrinogen IX oxidase n=1 Tax=Fulvivirga sedimenti TaxID=2879465 RepID=A0A9X1HU97_9BACT|nr:CopD family protein [Fulvivirga sedimenti]MCA6078045.1 CopD family protein [Fulvivirga sedimenti]
MTYLYIKALHIIFVVTWFAGLFYIVRIFIYHIEANEREEPARSVLIQEYVRNARRLWLGITWPSAILTLIFGLWLLYLIPEYLSQGFMQLKLVLVLLLYVYQLLCHRIYRQLQNHSIRFTSQQLRIWNEVATLFLFGIVFLIVLKSAMNMVIGLAGFVILAIILFVAIRLYKNVRLKNEKE